MTTVTLAHPWDYRTTALTIAYPAGEHEVTPEIAAAARKAGVSARKEQTDGAPATTSPGRTRRVKG